MTNDALNPDNARAVMKSIRRIAHAIDARSKRIGRETGLTIPQIVVLQAVADQGALTTAAISKQADLSPATTVTILDKLEAKGLIERSRSLEDRRKVRAMLTEAGLQTLSSAPSLFADGFAADFSAFSAIEQEAIVTSFIRVADLLDPGADEVEAEVRPPQ
ncbi:MarR family winged helix-turn-helix transcriptional regulator [Martelella endophytica]|uniref:MarR family transcriptional regulator n=1 Tax=Martelella endophytica TaxID=1486262 RepID=A0A0D5LNC5_MAREN|nr:MarR family transcriptional regulator [Martelella endophytica]AJY45729.1 MarR family transcriptional regulator [Martelella endophytica]